jgi:hypothetical protein
MEGQNEPADEPVDDEPGKARALTIHLLRMLRRVSTGGYAPAGRDAVVRRACNGA